jgi:hypothetical protein
MKQIRKTEKEKKNREKNIKGPRGNLSGPTPKQPTAHPGSL